MQINLLLRCSRSGKALLSRIKIVCYCLFLVLCLSSCRFMFTSYVDIYIKNDMTDKNDVFDATAYIGGTKDSSGYIQPGESGGLVLTPVAERVEILIFLYGVQNKQYQWEELKIEPKKKYTMEMIFNKPDQFQYRICQRPCLLKGVNWHHGTAYKSYGHAEKAE